MAKLLQRLPAHSYQTLQNVILYGKNGMTQIDHLVISIYGIFIIETKNYHGVITGKTHSENWKVSYGKKSYPFRNPLKQNYAHEKTLREVCNLPKDSGIISMVVFPNQAILDVDTDAHILMQKELLRCIRSYQLRRFSNEEFLELIEKFQQKNIRSKPAETLHREQVETERAYHNFAHKHNLCPRCGSPLFPVTVNEETFLRCSAFPKCNYRQELYETF